MQSILKLVIWESSRADVDEGLCHEFDYYLNQKIFQFQFSLFQIWKLFTNIFDFTTTKILSLTSLKKSPWWWAWAWRWKIYSRKSVLQTEGVAFEGFQHLAGGLWWKGAVSRIVANVGSSNCSSHFCSGVKILWKRDSEVHVSCIFQSNRRVCELISPFFQPERKNNPTKSFAVAFSLEKTSILSALYVMTVHHGTLNPSYETPD